MAIAPAVSRRSSPPGLAAVAHIRWDRVGRLAMLCVLAAIAYLYLSAGLSLLSTWRESKHDSAQVLVLERQNRMLTRQHAELLSSGMLQAQARRMGMIRPGELAFLVSNLPSD
jgi:cell division protein FtsB